MTDKLAERLREATATPDACPSCKGSGEAIGFVNTGDDTSKHYYGAIKCPRCKGSGHVDAAMPEWLLLGAAFRAERAEEGLLMGEVARRLGVSVVDVSKAYNGYINPAPMIEEWRRIDYQTNGS